MTFPDPDDAPVAIEPGMRFWIQFDRELIGARGETGFAHPEAVEAALDRKGIFRAENRDAAKRMLDAIAGGRNQAMSEKIEPERTTKPKPTAGKQ